MSDSKAVAGVENLSPKSQSNIDQLLAEGMDSVERVMFEVVNSEVATLRDASRHILEAGGKRVRPRLLLLSYLLSGGKNIHDAARIAAAVELVHTASVVHDDINDHGVVRRGRPSVNAIWGRTFALLTGDFLFTKVYELMAPYKDLNILLAEATVALVEGETLQAAAVKERNFSREIYFKIIARKTAALFKAAAALGAKLANTTEQRITALQNYGYNIGLAFQIIDDLLDLTADTEKLGKTAGIDVAQGRGFAVAYNSNGGPQGAVATSTEETDDLMLEIKRKMIDASTIEKGQAQAVQLVQLAHASVEVFPESPAKTALIDLANMVLLREF